jgi:SAM-dependent methyltransferase
MGGSTINVSSSPDFGRRADDYATHRRGFPPSLFERLRAQEVLRPGLRALDLGAGTGSIALSLAHAGASVWALDISAPLLAVVRDRARAASLDVQCVRASAEETGLPSGAFDLVCAGQCWHWFDSAAAARECKRLLAPGGALVVAHFDWIAAQGSYTKAALDVVERFGSFPARAYVGVAATYPCWLEDLRAAGFSVESFSYDVDVPYDHQSFRGRLRASGALCELDEATLARFDVEYDRDVAGRFDEPGSLPHRVYAIVAR